MWQPGGSSSACPGCRMGQHVPRQGWGGISTHPGQLAQKGPKIAHTKALQAQWSFIPWWSLCRDCRNPNPSGICLSGTASPQAGGPGDSDRPELEAALLRGLFVGLPKDTSAAHESPRALPGLSRASPGAPGLASSAGDTRWQLSTSLYTTVCYVHTVLHC